jgi:hypothetical protein
MQNEPDLCPPNRHGTQLKTLAWSMTALNKATVNGPLHRKSFSDWAVDTVLIH